MYTRLGSDGYGVRRTGSFAGKTASGAGTHPVGVLTRLGSDGYGVRRVVSFAGKAGSSGAHPVGVLTRLGLDGYGVRRVVSFAGKTPSPVVVVTADDIGGRLSNWFQQVADAKVALSHTRVRIHARPVYVHATDPAAVTGRFTGYMTSLPGPTPEVETVHARVRLPAARVHTAAQPLRARGAASALLPTTRATTRVGRVVVAAGAAVTIGDTRTLTAARDLDEVYAQINVSDEDLLLLATELVYNQP